MTTPAEIGRYKVLGELGRGAMGVVYRGVDPALDRQVAIKVISGHQAAGSLQMSELEARFLREAKIAARINHPGVVTVFDAGRAGDSLYLVMELIDGEPLSQRLVRHDYPSMPEAFLLVAQTAEALAAAHMLGVVHRDIKPANIMLTREGRVKVADFGVAKAIGEGTELTRTGTVVGSPAYMAPEQVRGQSPDGRADLFSLGVVLYELLLHRKPFPADTITSLIYQILHEDPMGEATTGGGLGRDVEEFLRRALAKEADRRFPDGIAFAAEARAIAALLPDSSLSSTSATRVVETPGLPSPREPVPKALWFVAAGLALLGVLIVTFLVVRRHAVPAGEGATLTAAVAPTASPQPTPPPPTAEPMAVTPEGGSSATAGAVPPSPATGEPSIPHLRLGSEPASARGASGFPAGALGSGAGSAPQVPVEPTPTPVITEIFECRQGANFRVSPQKAEVAINGKVIGIADDWDGVLFGKLGKTYYFGGPGAYFVRLTATGRRTTWVKIIVRPEARKAIVNVDTKLPKLEQ